MLAAAATVASASQEFDEEALMRSYIAALIARDAEYIREHSHPEVRYDPEFRDRHTAGQIEDQVKAILEKTRDCDIGAVMRGTGSLNYTVHWWCNYRDVPEGSPLEGAGAVLRVREGRIEISNFNWSGPYSVGPRRVG
jgi:hypothetical protein